jgi:Icc-related predicted phosphoesterase
MATNSTTNRSRRTRRSLRLALLSDTHELHREVDVPDADILIHCGDFTMFSRSMKAVADFNQWLGELPHRHKIVVPGNHELFLEADPRKRSLLTNAIVLIDEEVKVDGLRIWGSPVTPLSGGAFGLSTANDRRQLYAQIKPDIDILITHGPPFGILDRSPASDIHSGCQELLQAVRRVRPKLHVFGHVHGTPGLVQTDRTTFANVAVLGLDGAPAVAPMLMLMSTGA